MNDFKIREASRAAIQKIVQTRGTNILPWNVISEGFSVNEQKIFFVTKAAGIFKPKELKDGAALSIKTVLPSRTGREAPYNDAELSDGLFSYRFERSGRDNHLLIEAHRNCIPLIFFRGLADALYETIYPVFIRSLDSESSEAVISIGEKDESTGEPDMAAEYPIKKGYSLGLRKSRQHQAAFRSRVLPAYGFRCAISGLPVPELLEAAHIIGDATGGEASVRNGIALSNLHHTAYEQHLLGIDGLGRVHISRRLALTKDGPLLEHGLLRWNGEQIRMPSFRGHKPHQDFLAARFLDFQLKNSS